MASKPPSKTAKAARKSAAPRTAAKKAPPRTAKTQRKPAAAPADAVSAAQRIDEKIASLGDWRGERLAEIRALIHEADPGVVEEWKWMGTPVWSHDGMYANANPFKNKVKITFHHGAQLRDPKGLFNAGLDGNKWRAIDLYESDRIDKAGLKALLREAVAYNTTHAVPRSKGSRASLLRSAASAAPESGKPAAKAKPASAKAASKPAAKPAKAASKPARRAAGAGERTGTGGGKGPTLLAGGNPQIAKGDGDGPVQAYIAAMPGWKHDVGRALDALIVRTVPGVRKAVKWNSPFYGLEGQGWFLSYHCFTKYVKVTFFRGASLRPLPPGASKHEDVRYLDIYEAGPTDEAQLADWIRQAAAQPGWVP